MSAFQYSPLTYQSFGFGGLDPLLKGLGQNYGFLGKYNYQFPNQYPNAYRAGDYLFNNQQGYNDLNSILSGRAGFLDEQLKSNAAAYNEYAAKPYAFNTNTPFKTSAQKAAEAEAARQAALLASQGGTTSPTQGTVQQQPVGHAAAPTVSVANLVPLPVPSKDQLPDYIPPNNNALIRELKKLLGDIPGLFSTAGITNAFRHQAGIDESFGAQAASNAAAQFANQTTAQGGDPSLSGLVRAQALLPVLQHTAQLRSDLQDKKLQARQGQGTLTANVAEALANLRTNYLKGLIDYTGKIQDIQSTNQISTQKLNEQQREFDLSNELDKLRVSLQGRQVSSQEKQDKLRALLAIADLQGKKRPETNNYFGLGDPRFDPNYINKPNVEYNDQLQALLGQLGALT